MQENETLTHLPDELVKPVDAQASKEQKALTGASAVIAEGRTGTIDATECSVSPNSSRGFDISSASVSRARNRGRSFQPDDFHPEGSSTAYAAPEKLLGVISINSASFSWNEGGSVDKHAQIFAQLAEPNSKSKKSSRRKKHGSGPGPSSDPASVETNPRASTGEGKNGYHSQGEVQGIGFVSIRLERFSAVVARCGCLSSRIHVVSVSKGSRDKSAMCLRRSSICDVCWHRRATESTALPKL